MAIIFLLWVSCEGSGLNVFRLEKTPRPNYPHTIKGEKRYLQMLTLDMEVLWQKATSLNEPRGPHAKTCLRSFHKHEVSQAWETPTLKHSTWDDQCVCACVMMQWTKTNHRMLSFSTQAHQIHLHESAGRYLAQSKKRERIKDREKGKEREREEKKEKEISAACLFPISQHIKNIGGIRY